MAQSNRMRHAASGASIAAASFCTAVVLGFALATLPALGAQSAGDDDPQFVFRFAQTPAPDECVIHTFQTGPFGGVGDWRSTRSENGTYIVRTGYNGQPAETLKASVWCRGYGIVRVDVPSLDRSGWELVVDLMPLPDIPLAGRLLPPGDGVNLAGAELRVWYLASWLCGFYGLLDCGVPQWEIARGRIRSDGTFRILLPDFANDPAVGSSPGRLMLMVQRTEAPYNYSVEPLGDAWGLPVSAAYSELVVRPRRR